MTRYYWPSEMISEPLDIGSGVTRDDHQCLTISSIKCIEYLAPRKLSGPTYIVKVVARGVGDPLQKIT